MAQVSRRFFLQGLSALTAAASTSLVTGGVKNAHAAGGVGSNGNILLIVNLAGGMDTYGTLQRNFGTLADVRPTLFRNMSDSNLILPLTGSMGVHASFPVLKQEWDAGNVAILNKVGYENISRSHADADMAYARGVADRKDSVTSGWLSRLGASYFPAVPFAVWDLSGGHKTSRGPYRANTVRNLDDYGFERDWQAGSSETNFRIDTLLSTLRDWPGLQGEQLKTNASWTAVENAIATIEALPEVEGYPNSGLGRQLRDFDRALFIDETKVGFVRTGGYDTHGDQEPRLENLLSGLNAALSVFIARMKQRGLWDRTIIYINSEFGRTIRENGNRGTDHGGAIDSIVISPLARGGEHGVAYADADFQQRQNYVLPTTNVVNLYADLIRMLGFDPGPVVGNASGGTGVF